MAFKCQWYNAADLGGTVYINGIVLKRQVRTSATRCAEGILVLRLVTLTGILHPFPVAFGVILTPVYDIFYPLNIVPPQARQGLVGYPVICLARQFISSTRLRMTPCMNRGNLVLGD